MCACRHGLLLRLYFVLHGSVESSRRPRILLNSSVCACVEWCRPQWAALECRMGRCSTLHAFNYLCCVFLFEISSSTSGKHFGCSLLDGGVAFHAMRVAEKDALLANVRFPTSCVPHSIVSVSTLVGACGMRESHVCDNLWILVLCF